MSKKTKPAPFPESGGVWETDSKGGLQRVDLPAPEPAAQDKPTAEKVKKDGPAK